MISIFDHRHNASGLRDSSRIEEDLAKTCILDHLSMYMDYYIHQRWRGYKPEPFEKWRTSKVMGENTSMRQWYLWHFQKL